MARPRKTSSAPPLIPSNSLVASAVRYPKNAARIYFKPGTNWQADCYRHYAICGEARFAARFFGRAMAKAVLKVGRPKQGAAGREEITDGPAREYIDNLFNGTDGQAQMLESIGVHLTIAGECFLIGRTGKDPRTGEENEQEVWEIVSPLEVKVVGKKWQVSYGDDISPVDLDDETDVVIRIWNPKPGNRMEADSPFRALLPVLSEIEWLTRHVFAQISSRLAGSGLLFLPQGMTFPTPPAQDGEDAPEAQTEADAMMLSLADAMMTPLSDPSSPSALVPLIVTAPGEEIDKARLMTFWSELDAAALALRNEAIRRFAVGMDLPPEQILGMSSSSGTGGGTSNGVSHWGAWQIEESTIKMFVEPVLDLVVNALTVAYLRPALEENGTPGDEVVYHDTSALRLRPDRSQESLELNDRGLVSDAVVMRENGFDPISDAMDDKGREIWLLRKIASGSATPEQVGAALKALGVDLGISAPLPDAQPEQIRESRPAPSLEDHPTRPRTPERTAGLTPPSPSLAVLTACDGLVWRALEKAGNRHLNARTRGKDRDRSIDPCAFHVAAAINGEGPSLLDGAFEYAPRVLDGIAPTDETVGILNDYCLALFSTQSEHTRENLAEYLEMRA